MTRYFLTNGTHSICRNREDDLVVERDSANNNPIATFDTMNQAKNILFEDGSFAEYQGPFIVTPVDQSN